jgi:hypothetical protein
MDTLANQIANLAVSGRPGIRVDNGERAKWESNSNFARLWHRRPRRVRCNPRTVTITGTDSTKLRQAGETPRRRSTLANLCGTIHGASGRGIVPALQPTIGPTFRAGSLPARKRPHRRLLLFTPRVSWCVGTPCGFPSGSGRSTASTEPLYLLAVERGPRILVPRSPLPPTVVPSDGYVDLRRQDEQGRTRASICFRAPYDLRNFGRPLSHRSSSETDAWDLWSYIGEEMSRPGPRKRLGRLLRHGAAVLVIRIAPYGRAFA